MDNTEFANTTLLSKESILLLHYFSIPPVSFQRCRVEGSNAIYITTFVHCLCSADIQSICRYIFPTVPFFFLTTYASYLYFFFFNDLINCFCILPRNQGYEIKTDGICQSRKDLNHQNRLDYLENDNQTRCRKLCLNQPNF